MLGRMRTIAYVVAIRLRDRLDWLTGLLAERVVGGMG